MKYLKNINEKYKYFVLFIILLLALTVFAGLATGGDKKQATNTNTNTEANTQNTATDNQQPKNNYDLLEQQLDDARTLASSEPDAEVLGEGDEEDASSDALPERDLSLERTMAFIGDFTQAMTISTQASTGGALGLTRELYESEPASVSVWATDIRSRIDPSVSADSSESDTYNPGSGYELLLPIRDLWQTMVNFVYIFYIVILVLIAFLILFRSQMGGQEAVTLYNAIPSLLISLFFVYFSYPLSAIFIDLVTIGGGVVYGVMVGPDANSGAPGAFLHERSLSGNFIGDITYGSENEDIGAKTQLQIDDKEISVWRVFTSSNFQVYTNGIDTIVPREANLGDQLFNFVSSIVDSDLLPNILLFVLSFAGFAASIKLFFALLKQYIYLVAYPIISPLIFLLAAIPNQTNKLIVSYFSRLLAASLSFIAVYAVFLVIIIVGQGQHTAVESAWVPPLLGYGNDPNIDTGNLSRTLIAYSLFLSAPLIPDFINNQLQVAGQNAFLQEVVSGTKSGAKRFYGLAAGAYSIGRNAIGAPAGGGGGGR